MPSKSRFVPMGGRVALSVALAGIAAAQQAPTPAPLTASTTARTQTRFVAAHGRKGVVMGYADTGLEVWAYPFQILQNYTVAFVPPGSTSEVDGRTLLRSVDYTPDSIVRTYRGNGFEIRETLFVPLDEPAAIIRYAVEGPNAPDIRVSFLPTLQLMWPGGLGGQDLGWRDPLHAYVISERSSGARAVIASPQQTSRTEVVNSTRRESLAQSMVLHPQNGIAEMLIGLDPPDAEEGSEIARIRMHEDAWRAASRQHADAVLASGLVITTPDAKFNAALQWSKTALDQAWVCNGRLGCGIVGGFGPSRGVWRPQYDWFFAGDGMVAIQGMLAEGNTERARQELEFIFKYQNPENGMVWHELSQSAGYIDWKSYPYMFVHVDLTFDFLVTLGDYYAATGDTDFIRAHWSAIEAAYRYCRAQVPAGKALPEIPAGKEGANEQEAMREDVGLSASWVRAAEAYAQLAAATGRMADQTMPHAARNAFASRYWDASKQFWIMGYSASGAPMADLRAHSDLLGMALLKPPQEAAVIDRLTSASFQTDWGTRSMSSGSPHYNPESYASGSVSAVLTASTAAAFWREHRPDAAWSTWNALLPWFDLDSLGHIHEVAAGDTFRPQIESVPEQTWSAAGVLSSAAQGVFGITVDAPAHRLELAPHLDPHWGDVKIGGIRVGAASMDASITQSLHDVQLTVAENIGQATVRFAPEIPLGATGLKAMVNGREVHVTLQQHDQDEHAVVDMPAGAQHCTVSFVGGVRLWVPHVTPALGDASRGLKLTQMHLSGHTLRLQADVADAENASVELQSAWKLRSADGASVTPLGQNWYRVTFNRAPARTGYQSSMATVEFSK